MHDIYERIAVHCRCCHVPERWRRFAAEVECYHCPAEAMAQIVEELAQDFSADELLAAGILDRGPDGLAICSDFDNRADVFFPVRSVAGDPPHQLITTAGVMGSSLPRAVNSCWPVIQDTESDASFPVLGVLSIDDLVAVRSIGLPVLFAGRLTECGADQLAEFCAHFGAGELPSGDEHAVEAAEADRLGALSAAEDSLGIDQWLTTAREDDGWSLSLQLARTEETSLILVDASLAELNDSRSPELPAAVEILAGADRYLGWDLSSVGIWRPHKQALEALGFLVRHGKSWQVAECIAQQIAASALSLDGWLARRSRDQRSRDYPAARRALRKLFRADPQETDWPEKFQAAVDRMLDTAQRAICEPLLRQAMATSDRMEQARLLCLANVAQLLEHHSPLVHLEMSRALSRPRKVPKLTRLKDHLALVREASNLVRTKK